MSIYNKFCINAYPNLIDLDIKNKVVFRNSSYMNWTRKLVQMNVSYLWQRISESKSSLKDWLYDIMNSVSWNVEILAELRVQLQWLIASLPQYVGI